ncbi:MAG: monofunctional biosynthetic peptidoglycan transglycosylase [Ignavibacteria bacterium]|nr:monofunctional biosynthetic peptidoglycan transglycosylase [Ignavibacteria bacterium]
MKFEHLRRRLPWIVVAALAAWVALEIVLLPFGAIRELRRINPSETAFMRDYISRTEEAGRRPRLRHRWIPLGQIPLHARNAVILAEDGAFWSHSGFDWFEFGESLKKNFAELRAARGASTISQQLVKNLYLSPSKNPMRKIKEWILTWWLEQSLRKERILEVYLNVIEWGDGVYGVQAGAQYHFGKDASLLTREEGARMAAMIPSPRRYKPGQTTRYLDRYTRTILTRMNARNM